MNALPALRTPICKSTPVGSLVLLDTTLTALNLSVYFASPRAMSAQPRHPVFLAFKDNTSTKRSVIWNAKRTNSSRSLPAWTVQVIANSAHQLNACFVWESRCSKGEYVSTNAISTIIFPKTKPPASPKQLLSYLQWIFSKPNMCQSHSALLPSWFCSQSLPVSCMWKWRLSLAVWWGSVPFWNSAVGCVYLDFNSVNTQLGL